MFTTAPKQIFSEILLFAKKKSYTININYFKIINYVIMYKRKSKSLIFV